MICCDKVQKLVFAVIVPPQLKAGVTIFSTTFFFSLVLPTFLSRELHPRTVGNSRPRLLALAHAQRLPDPFLTGVKGRSVECPLASIPNCGHVLHRSSRRLRAPVAPTKATSDRPSVEISGQETRSPACGSVAPFLQLEELPASPPVATKRTLPFAIKSPQDVDSPAEPMVLHRG